MRREDKTRKEYRAEHARWSEQDLAQHQVERVGEGRWRCAAPGTLVHSFRVIESPGAILLYGDVGDVLWLVGGHSPLAWFQGAHRSADYTFEKLPRALREQRVFLDGEVPTLVEFLVEESDYARGAVSQAVADFRERCANDPWGEPSFERCFYEAFEELFECDSESLQTSWESLTDWSGELWRCHHALAWFCETGAWRG